MPAYTSRRSPYSLRLVTFILPIISVLIVSAPKAQISYHDYRDVSRLAVQTPWSGPGAALLNPAALAEVNWAHAHVTYLSSYTKSFLSGPVYQLAAGLPIGLAAGYASYDLPFGLDNSQPILKEAASVPALAIGWPQNRESHHRILLGAALPTFTFSSFGAVRNRTTSLDLGLVWIAKSSVTHEQFRLGLALHRIVPPKVRLPDGRGSFRIAPETDLTGTWTSPGNMFEINAELAAIGGPEPNHPIRNPSGFSTSEAWMGLKAWGLEYRPMDWLASKVERPLLGSYLYWGLVLRPNFIPQLGITVKDLFVELNINHPRYLHPPFPEWVWGRDEEFDDRGFMWGLSFGGGF